MTAGNSTAAEDPTEGQLVGETEIAAQDEVLVLDPEGASVNVEWLLLQTMTTRKSRTAETPFRGELTEEVIRAAQREDAVTRRIIQWLEGTREVPTNQELVTLDPEVQELHSQRESLVIRGGILYREFYANDGIVNFHQVVVPPVLREAYLSKVHDESTTGHMAVQKTQERLRQLAYWYGWKSDVRIFVQLCSQCCRYRRGPKFRQGELQLAHGCQPMQKVHIDLTGPHVNSSRQKKYLMTAICSFTKYLVAVPIGDKTAYSVARALVEHIYLVYGPMEIIVHDGGKEFVNDLMTQLTRLMGTQVSRITPYRASSNGVIERVHGTINAIFAKTIAANQRDWCQRAAFVAYAYNTAFHRSTTYSPFFLMFGRHPATSLHWLCEQSAPEFASTMDEYAEAVQSRMRAAYVAVRQHLRCSFDRAKARYDYRVKSRQFREGEYVWYATSRRKAGLGRKWQLATTGPYRITRRLNAVNYIVQRTPSSRSFIVHIDKLSKFAGRLPDCWERMDTRPTSLSDTEAMATAAAAAKRLKKTPVARQEAALPGRAADQSMASQPGRMEDSPARRWEGHERPHRAIQRPARLLD
jgi:hypothetical protein